jgi:hypothetical protein
MLGFKCRVPKQYNSSVHACVHLHLLLRLLGLGGGRRAHCRQPIRLCVVLRLDHRGGVLDRAQQTAHAVGGDDGVHGRLELARGLVLPQGGEVALEVELGQLLRRLAQPRVCDGLLHRQALRVVHRQQTPARS